MPKLLRGGLCALVPAYFKVDPSLVSLLLFIYIIVGFSSFCIIKVSDSSYVYVLLYSTLGIVD